MHQALCAAPSGAPPCRRPHCATAPPARPGARRSATPAAWVSGRSRGHTDKGKRGPTFLTIRYTSVTSWSAMTTVAVKE